MHVDLGRPHDVVDSKVVQPALAEVMVVELHCEGEPACIPLRHDDMQVGIALEHTAVRHPAQRFAHAAALHVPADVLSPRIRHQAGPDQRAAQPADVHRDRNPQAVRGLPERLPLRHVVGTLEDPVRQQCRTKTHTRGALELGHRGGNVLERQVDTGRHSVEIGAPRLGQPVVDHLAVGGVRVGGNGVGHVSDAADKDRPVHPVTFEVGELFSGVEARMSLGHNVSHRARRIRGDVGLRTLTGHHRHRHDVSGLENIPTVLVLLDAWEELAVMLGKLVDEFVGRRDMAVRRDEPFRHHALLLRLTSVRSGGPRVKGSPGRRTSSGMSGNPSNPGCG